MKFRLLPLAVFLAVLAIAGAASAQYPPPPIQAILQPGVTANGNGASINVYGYGTVTITVTCTTCSGGTTVDFQATQDGKNWQPVLGVQSGTTTGATSTTASGVTVWQVNVSGFVSFRTPVASYSAGTVTVTATAVAVANRNGQTTVVALGFYIVDGSSTNYIVDSSGTNYLVSPQ